MEPNPDAADVLIIPPPGRNWLVIHARPRCEKKIVVHCDREKIASYLPLRAKTHRYGARERVFLSPLFPGYLFCVANREERSHLRQNRFVANVLEVPDQVKFVEQLRHIRLALDTGNIVEVVSYLEAGKRVRVTAGPLRGFEGIIQRVKGRTRVVVNVDMIQRAMAVDVDSWMIQPA